MPLDFPTGVPQNHIYTAYGKSWRWNGEAWESVSALSISGTPNEITVDESGGSYTIGLPAYINVESGVRTQYLNLGGGATFTASPAGATVSNNMGISGNLNITGNLLVDGAIISKTGFSGYTLDGDVEPITDVSLDGGEF